MNYLKTKNKINRHTLFLLVWKKIFNCYDDEINDYIKTRDLDQMKKINIF